MNENKTPFALSIGQRSTLAPTGAVLIGTGNRAAKYAQLLEEKFLPMLLSASHVGGEYNSLIQAEIVHQLSTKTQVSEAKISSPVALHTLVLLARLVHAIKTMSPYSVRLNYQLSRTIEINVQQVIVDYALKHEDFFMSLYSLAYPKKPDAEPSLPTKEVEPTEPIVEDQPAAEDA